MSNVQYKYDTERKNDVSGKWLVMAVLSVAGQGAE